jgi:hypothetical protein
MECLSLLSILLATVGAFSSLLIAIRSLWEVSRKERAICHLKVALINNESARNEFLIWMKHLEEEKNKIEKSYSVLEFRKYYLDNLLNLIDDKDRRYIAESLFQSSAKGRFYYLLKIREDLIKCYKKTMEMSM